MNLLPDQATLLLPFRPAFLNGAQPLSVGVVLDRNPPSRWVDALLHFLRKIPGIDIQLLTVANQTGSTRPAWLLDRLYSESRARFDPFGDLALDGTTPAVDPESIDAIRAAGCGAIIWLASCQAPGIELASLAKHGVFTVRFGDRNQTIPYWDEVANCSPTSAATIFWHDSTFLHGRALRKAATCTLPGLYITENAEQPVIAAIRMLAALCLKIQADGAKFAEWARGLATQPIGETSRLERPPRNLEAARFVASKLMRSAHLRWAARGKKLNWFVALRPNRGGSITDPAKMDLTGFKEVPMPGGLEQMADPFLWEAGGRQYLLFEAVLEGQARGLLACVELSRDGACAEVQIILKPRYHISYPCVVPSNGELFLLPETAEANRVDLYRFTRFPWELELVSSPIVGVSLTDTTPVFVDGRWYFFTTTPDPFMETLLFTATRLEGPWKLHPGNPVSTSVRSCRSAGQLFWKDGRLFRPTQDCSVRYGYAIALNEVTRLTPHDFAERPVSYVPPSWRSDLLGTHTWSESSAFQAIDGFQYLK